MTEFNYPYKIELFLSTDGKHTVHVDIQDITQAAEALSKANTLYDKVVEKYGLQPSRSFKKDFAPKPPRQSGGTCNRHHVPMFLNKNGKPYHMDKTRAEGDQFCNGLGFQGENKPKDQIDEDLGWADSAEGYLQ